MVSFGGGFKKNYGIICINEESKEDLTIGQIFKMALSIQEYDFKIEHMKEIMSSFMFSLGTSSKWHLRDRTLR